MKRLIFSLLVLNSSAVNASHPICSTEDGGFKFIISKEENLTFENLDKALDRIRSLSKTNLEGEHDLISLSLNLQFIGVYFEKKQLDKMLKEGKSFDEERAKRYCRDIGKLTKSSSD